METSSAASRIQANLQDLFSADLAAGDAYIRFQLTSDMSALLSMSQVQESLVVPAEKITPLPSLPESVIGIMSSRDRVFCVFDLAQTLSLPSRLVALQQYQVIVLDVSKLVSAEQELYVGLAVERLQGITRLASEQVNLSTDSFPHAIALYLQGSVIKEDQITPILDLKKVTKILTLNS
ncbi:MAG: chemotaxis protein CheW [Thermosynechococcaceae cyanobacterium]